MEVEAEVIVIGAGAWKRMSPSLRFGVRRGGVLNFLEFVLMKESNCFFPYACGLSFRSLLFG